MKLKHVFLSGMLATMLALTLLTIFLPQTAEAGKPVIECYDCNTGSSLTAPDGTFSRPEAKTACEFGPAYCTVNGKMLCSNTSYPSCPAN